MRIAEGVGSEWLGCSKRFLRAELNISEARHGEGQRVKMRRTQRGTVRLSRRVIGLDGRQVAIETLDLNRRQLPRATLRQR